MTAPYLEKDFIIELQNKAGEKLGYFTAITGGSMSIVVVEHTLMQDKGGSRGIYIPTCTNFEPVTLSFGVTNNLKFWTWWGEMASGRRNRIDISIFATGSNGKSKSQWNLEDVWPSRISGFRFDVDSGNYLLASVTLVAENIERVK